MRLRQGVIEMKTTVMTPVTLLPVILTDWTYRRYMLRKVYRARGTFTDEIGRTYEVIRVYLDR